MSLRRESDVDEEDDDDDDDDDDALEGVRFLGVNVEGSAVMASYVGLRSMVLAWLEEWWLWV